MVTKQQKEKIGTPWLTLLLCPFLFLFSFLPYSHADDD